MTGTLSPDWRRTPAETAADILLEIQAIHIRPEDPFTFTSGRLSPVYVDCRKIISFPRARRRLMAMGVEQLTALAGAEAFDMVAGGETAGIPFAAWMADALDLPMLYVRKKPKGFGRNARIEGEVRDGARVLLVEDLATDGGSKISFIDAIREAGMQVAHCFVVFHYGVFPQSVTNRRDLLLWHLPRDRTAPRGPRHSPASPLHLVGRAGGGRAPGLHGRTTRRGPGVPGRPGSLGRPSPHRHRMTASSRKGETRC